MDRANPEIGCIILTEPFFFDRENWIPVPDDWSKSIVTGKTYDTITETGNRLYKDVLERIQLSDKNRYSESLVKHRLGQGAFRVGVVDAYGGRCAVTGEKTLPVLEAAHIKPYAEEGPHEIDNGILLRSDLHILFDDGYITVVLLYSSIKFMCNEIDVFIFVSDFFVCSRGCRKSTNYI